MRPIYAFVHIPKTGGTTINVHLDRNFKEDEKLYVRFGKRFYNVKNKCYEILRDENHLRSYLLSLSIKQKNRLKIIYGHDVFYGIHIFIGRKVIYFSSFRDVVSHRRSLFMQQQKIDKIVEYDFRGIPEKENKSEEVKDFEAWIYTRPQLDYQIKYLRIKGFIKDDVKSHFDKFSRLGFVINANNLSNEILFLGKILGFKRFFLNKNVSRKLPEISKFMETLITLNNLEVINYSYLIVNKNIANYCIKKGIKITFVDRIRRNIMIVPSEIERNLLFLRIKIEDFLNVR